MHTKFTITTALKTLNANFTEGDVLTGTFSHAFWVPIVIGDISWSLWRVSSGSLHGCYMKFCKFSNIACVCFTVCRPGLWAMFIFYNPYFVYHMVILNQENGDTLFILRMIYYSVSCTGKLGNNNIGVLLSEVEPKTFRLLVQTLYHRLSYRRLVGAKDIKQGS